MQHSFISYSLCILRCAFVDSGDRVILNSYVTEVKQSSSDAVVLVTENGEEYQV